MTPTFAAPRASKPFTTVAVALLWIVAIVHAWRLADEWDVTINGLVVPMWVSAIAFVVAAGLAVLVWRESRATDTRESA